MNKTAFVILHYETVNDTEMCIKSLVKFIDLHNAYIIVVDNGSKEGTLEKLESIYSSNDNIIFLRSEMNLGFARGNNIGFQYAKKYLDVNFIILTNSDTIFEQRNFIVNLEEEYKETAFDIAGPKIISLMDGKNQNPVNKIYNSQLDVKKRLLKFRLLLLLSYFNLDTLIKKFISNEIIEQNLDNLSNYQLHGACLIFTGNYIKKYDGLYDKTFMYGEESILKYIAERDNLKMVYIDRIEMYHKEGSSTNAIYGAGKKKRQFFYKWNIEGCKLLNNLMEDEYAKEG